MIEYDALREEHEDIKRAIKSLERDLRDESNQRWRRFMVEELDDLRYREGELYVLLTQAAHKREWEVD